MRGLVRLGQVRIDEVRIEFKMSDIHCFKKTKNASAGVFLVTSK
jgi:hypothetical protein